MNKRKIQYLKYTVTCLGVAAETVLVLSPNILSYNTCMHNCFLACKLMNFVI